MDMAKKLCRRFLAFAMALCLMVPMVPALSEAGTMVDGIPLIEQYKLEGDSGDGLSMYEAAEYAMKYAVRPTVEVDDMKLVFDSLPMVEGRECYGFTVTDEPGNKEAEWLKVAVGYDGKVYLQDVSSGEYFEVDQDEAEPEQTGLPQFVEYEPLEDLQYLDSQEGDDGSYRLYTETADGVVAITNAAFASKDFAGEDAEAKAKECVALLSGDTHAYKIRVFEDAEYTAQLGNPSYLVSWNSDDSENPREYVALVTFTDPLVYVYAFGVGQGKFEEYRDRMYKVLDSIKLEEVFG